MLSADHVYRFDYTEAIETHRAAGAECTIVTTEVPVAEAGDHAVVAYDDDAGSPTSPTSPRTRSPARSRPRSSSTTRLVLIEVLEELHRELSGESEPGDTGLGDFGEHLVPRLVARGARWRTRSTATGATSGQPHHYLQAHQDVLTDDVGVLGVRRWPILTRQPQRVPGRVLDGGRVVDSMLSPGARVAGLVHRSVLGPGVVVEAGAEVHNSVVFADSVVRAGARVTGRWWTPAA